MFGHVWVGELDHGKVTTIETWMRTRGTQPSANRCGGEPSQTLRPLLFHWDAIFVAVSDHTPIALQLV